IAAVEELDFVASVVPQLTLLEQVRQKRQDSLFASHPLPEETLLVSSPGYAVLDSGCGRTIVGINTLRCFETLWRQRGWAVPPWTEEIHQFKFGNGDIETSTHSVAMPVILASKRGVIKAAIIKGDAPLLLSRSALKALGATLNFEKDCLHVFQQVVPLKTNSAGQYIVHLVGQPADPVFAASFDEVMASVEAPDVEPESNTAPPDSAGTTASVPADEIACEPDPAVKTCLAVHARPRGKCLVMEVFPPPRFAIQAEEAGFRARSYDLKTGFDFRRSRDRKLVEEDLITDPPELLVLCPPCTDESGWVHLNSTKGDRLEYLKRRAQSRSYIRWCCKLFRLQTRNGGRAMFEHPTGSRLWTYPEMQSLCRVFETVKLHMCRYGLRLPSSEHYIRKSARLLVSHSDMQSLGLLCTGDAKHSCHDTVAGHAPGVAKVSEYAGQYPREFVQAVLNTLAKFREKHPEHGASNTCRAHPACLVEVLEDAVHPDAWTEILAAAQSQAKSDQELTPVLIRLHKNLGHPPNHDMVRILKHGDASEQALRLAKEFSCDFCKSQAPPTSPLPTQPNRVSEFNHQVGMDVKHLKGWLPNQKIRAVNLVDTASGFQRMIPFFETETASVLRKLLHEHWIAWAGAPKELVLDPARTNLGEQMMKPAEADGIHVRTIAAGAHWQLGKCESHGGWFNRFVFGRNPHIPHDLLNEPQSVIASTAALTDEGLARAQAMRTAARVALVKMQDDRSLRVALLARPRTSTPFQPGDLVAYWRNQKWAQGNLQQGGQWYGVAVLLGTVGRNLILVHRRNVIRCAPEQVRHATNEEKCLIATPETELLGVKDMITQGNLKSKQYLDLVPQSYPPQEGNDDIAPADPSHAPVAAPESPDVQMQADRPSASVAPPRQVENVSPPEEPPDDSLPLSSSNGNGPAEVEAPSEVEKPDSTAHSSSASSYGPIRRRVTGKDGPMTLWRPAALNQDDFVDVMREVVPQLVEDVIMSRDKRPRSPEAASSEPEAQRPRMEEALSVQEVSSLLDIADTQSWECLMSEYLKKKMSKELRHSNNPPKLQQKIQMGKRTEWETIVSKPHAVRIHYGKAAKKIKTEQPHRFIGSRFVLTRKPLEEGVEVDPNNWDTFTVKGRWCLQGHLDPDLTVKAEKGMLRSPTLSQLGRMSLMQVIASQGWDLQLGDIRGAFLEAGPLEESFRPLFAHQPPGGIPGLPEDAVIEVTGNVYGQNDAPAAWFKEFSSYVKTIGWRQSVLDPCLFVLRDRRSEALIGIMGVHVDDTAVGGSGAQFEESIKQLKHRFPYRKWRMKEGEFCGAWYRQESSKAIHMTMKAFADKIRPINIPKGSPPDRLLDASQIKVLRAVNGSLNWLSSQSRPDLSVQTSLSQQAFPRPTISDYRMANQAIRRAKQHDDLGIVFAPIDPKDLTIVCHSDAAFANRGNHTQAGYILGFTEKKLQESEEALWCPVAWRSFKLSRAVNSTLAAESQAMSVATGTLEWLLLLLSEILDGPLDIRTCRETLKRRRPIVVTDCKSLYDHLHSPSSPTSIEDRRTSIDVVIIRESARSMQAFVRWVPTNRMLADSLTKNDGDPVDLLRACMKRQKYQISPEETVLEYQALEKEQRRLRQAERK
ncbi:unnamed protein product, partial [Durusdinium trenchii]